MKAKTYINQNSMRAIIFTFTVLTLLTATCSFSQTTYTWVGGTSGNFTTAVNWSPVRANGQVSDILIFSNGTTVNANNVQQQTIGQLIITNNTHVIFTPASGNPKVLSINGGAGDDLRVDSGSVFEINGDSPRLGILLKTGTTGSVYGSIIIRAQQNHYINALDGNSLKFHRGSSLTQNSPGYIFTNSGTSNTVIFENGSSFIMKHPLASTPFGLDAPASKVTFNSNSTFILQASNSNGLNLNGRTYGNFILNMNASVQINEAFTSDVLFNDITIKKGAILNINNSNLNYTPSFNVIGNLNVNGNFLFTDSSTNNFKIKITGTNPQAIYGNGQIELPASLTDVEFNNSVRINMNTNVVAGCKVYVNTNLNLIDCKLIANTTVNPGASITSNNGYVIGNLTKYFTNNLRTQNFEIGTKNGYTPVTITFENIMNPGSLTVSTVAHTHPLVQDSTKAMKRYWTFTNNGIEFNHYSAIFHYLSSDFNTNFIESKDESTMIFKGFGTSKKGKENGFDIYFRDTLNNLIGIRNVENFGDLTIIKNETNVPATYGLVMNSVSKINNTNDVTSNNPKKFDLSQNYPNPFNPTTKIDYELPIPSSVSIKVYDINGREVSTLVNQNQTAGHYTVEFSSKNISSGVYFYKISATNGQQNFEKTNKMIISK
jgi:hypothetical protein